MSVGGIVRFPPRLRESAQRARYGAQAKKQSATNDTQRTARKNDRVLIGKVLSDSQAKARKPRGRKLNADVGRRPSQTPGRDRLSVAAQVAQRRPVDAEGKQTSREALAG